VRLDSRRGLIQLQERLAGFDGEILVVGEGSNLLVADGGFDGIALRLGGELRDSLGLDEGVVEVAGGLPLPQLARRLAALGRSGLEWAVGVPGSVGGGVRMNAGGHGSSISESLIQAEVSDLRGAPGSTWRPASDLRLGYRRSNIGRDEVVLAGRFVTAADESEVIAARIREIVAWRRANQPGGRNAGSVFKNPPDGPPAARLIEECGLKGFRVGSAAVSPRHANFIQADPGGLAADVWAVVRHVRARVRQERGIELETEVVAVGFAEERL
jgi:UDP-N-acetylmuramate dehydrogenase